MPVATHAPRVSGLSSLPAVISRWLLLNHPLLWRVRPSTLLLISLGGHVLASWSAANLPAPMLWDKELSLSWIPMFYAWALAAAVCILATRRMVVYRDAGLHPRQRLATLALAACVVAALASPADRFQQVMLQRQVASFTTEDAELVQRLSDLDLGPLVSASACTGWPSGWSGKSAARRLHDVMQRNQVDASMDEAALAAFIARAVAACDSRGAPATRPDGGLLSWHLNRLQPFADTRALLDASAWSGAAARHGVTLGLAFLFWLTLVLVSQPRRPPERRWMRRLVARVRAVARWPRLPLACWLEDRLLRSHPAWWAVWPFRILLLATLSCVLAATVVAALGDGGKRSVVEDAVMIFFGLLLSLALGIVLAWRCQQVPLAFGDLRHPGAFAVLVLATLLPLLPFGTLILWMSTSLRVKDVDQAGVMLALALVFITPPLQAACLMINVVRGWVTAVMTIVGILMTAVVAGSPAIQGPCLVGWGLGCLALSSRAVVPRRTGRRFGSGLVALVLTLAPAALVAAMNLAMVNKAITDEAIFGAGILVAWWIVLWVGPVQGMRRVLSAPSLR
jgi:hypothetical protein